MDDHNIRTGQMWSAIEKTIDFTDKQVIDLGCGHGDLIWRVYEAGALYVLGVDRDYRIVEEANERCEHHEVPQTVILANIERVFRYRYNFDVTFCLSVLPYLSMKYPEAIGCIHRLAPVGFFEIQYIGDGPGKELRDDRDAIELLKREYNKVEKIGHTICKKERLSRSIWRCQ